MSDRTRSRSPFLSRCQRIGTDVAVGIASALSTARRTYLQRADVAGTTSVQTHGTSEAVPLVVDLEAPSTDPTGGPSEVSADVHEQQGRAHVAISPTGTHTVSTFEDMVACPEPSELTVTEEHAECPICFEPLHSQPTVVLIKEAGKRVCRHLFHATCARSMASSTCGKSCPMCRASYITCLPVPDVEEDPRAWFHVVDSDGNGSLDCEEVGDVLKATLPVDCRKLDRTLPALFMKWSKGGGVGYDDMMGPGGLFYYVRDSFRLGRGAGEAPDIRKHPEAWFRYWDEDASGSLNREEVLRAIVKTFGLSSSLEQIRTVREMLTVLWPEFDPDGSGSIEKAEFCRSGDGLAQMIIANLGGAEEES